MRQGMLAVAGLALALLLPAPARAVEPVKRIDIYVQPYYAAATTAEGTPQVAVGDSFNRLLGSTVPDDILAARDLVQAKPGLVTPMTLMVLAIRLYDTGARDESVFWFYAAKGRYLSLAAVIDIEAAGLSGVASAVGAFAQLAGPVINGYAFCDLARQQEASNRAIDWVAAHPYEAIFMERLPARSGDRRANLEAAVAKLRAAAAEERAYLGDPKHLADFKATREKNGADAKFCWK